MLGILVVWSSTVSSTLVGWETATSFGAPSDEAKGEGSMVVESEGLTAESVPVSRTTLASRGFLGLTIFTVWSSSASTLDAGIFFSS